MVLWFSCWAEEQESWLPFPALLQTSCVSVGELLNYSLTHSSMRKTSIILSYLTGRCEEKSVSI